MGHPMLHKLVAAIVKANPDKAEQAKSRPALIGWFAGKAMKAMQGHLDPVEVNEVVKTELGL